MHLKGGIIILRIISLIKASEPSERNHRLVSSNTTLPDAKSEGNLPCLVGLPRVALLVHHYAVRLPSATTRGPLAPALAY